MLAVNTVRANLQQSLRLSSRRRWKTGGPSPSTSPIPSASPKLVERLAEAVKRGPFPVAAKETANSFLQKAESDKFLDCKEKVIGQPQEDVPSGSRVAAASMNADAEAGGPPEKVFNSRATGKSFGSDTAVRADKQ
ncbi:hypothetical protein HDU88_004012 [Geranomyces variabilis]|nr:hypothetical protein HDU88_004012 [Geranomyces variabilis]